MENPNSARRRGSIAWYRRESCVRRGDNRIIFNVRAVLAVLPEALGAVSGTGIPAYVGL
jgi:hypothetical protein